MFSFEGFPYVMFEKNVNLFRMSCIIWVPTGFKSPVSAISNISSLVAKTRNIKKNRMQKFLFDQTGAGLALLSFISIHLLHFIRDTSILLFYDFNIFFLLQVLSERMSFLILLFLRIGNTLWAKSFLKIFHWYYNILIFCRQKKYEVVPYFWF